MNNSKYLLAKKIWSYLLSIDRSRSTTYQVVAQECAETKFIPIIFQALHVIQDYCLSEGIPPLTILVTDNNGNVGPGFKGCLSGDMIECIKKVGKHDYGTLSQEFYGQCSAAMGLVDGNDGNESSLKNRGIAQSVFRDRLLKLYRNKCMACEINELKLIEACHIKPYAKCDDIEKIDRRNGLLLCRNHHRMFDENWILISTASELIISCDVNDKRKRIIQQSSILLQKLQSIPIISKMKNIRPSLSYIQDRYSK